MFIVISQCAEWICMYMEIPESIYRLTCLRYILLLYLGYVWTTNKISRSLTKHQIVLSLASLVILLVLYYTTGSLKPLLFDTDWRVFHWVSYFYVALLLPWILWKIFSIIPQKNRKLMALLGKCSYEVFLIQMMIFAIYPKRLLSTGNGHIDYIVFFIVTILVSSLSAIYWNRYKAVVNNRNN